MASILAGVAGTAIPAFLRSDMGQRLLSKVGLSSEMFSPAPQYQYRPDPYSTGPSMDVYQRDYVTTGDMRYMGPSGVQHVQEAARNGGNIRVVRRTRHKKAKKGKKKR